MKKTPEEKREYMREYMREYSRKNKEKVKENHRRYREKNRAKLNAKIKEYYWKNRTEINERRRAKRAHGNQNKYNKKVVEKMLAYADLFTTDVNHHLDGHEVKPKNIDMFLMVLVTTKWFKSFKILCVQEEALQFLFCLKNYGKIVDGLIKSHWFNTDIYDKRSRTLSKPEQVEFISVYDYETPIDTPEQPL